MNYRRHDHGLPSDHMPGTGWGGVASAIRISEAHKHEPRFPEHFPLILNHHRFDADHRIPANYHDYLEVSVVEAGEGYLNVREDRFPIRDGDVFLMGPGTMHTVTPDSPLVTRSLYFLPGLVHEPGGPQVNFDSLRLFYDRRYLFDPVINPGSSTDVQSLFNDLARNRNRSSRYRDLEARIMLFEVLLWTMKQYDVDHEDVPTSRAKGNAERLHRVLEWMRIHFREDLSLADAADVACVSVQYFCRFFKDAVGHTFTEHVARMRVALAKQLLLQQDLRTTDIAYDVGFGSQSNFFRTFKRITGATPQEFRNRSLG